MTLPVTVNSGAVVNEQCLTAELFAIPPTGPGDLLDNPYDNRAEYCFGSPRLEVFDEGEVRTWTIFVCKVFLDSPRILDNECDTADEVDVKVLASVVEDDEHGHSDDIRFLDFSTALIHIKDVTGRVFDDDANGSLTDENTVSWMTRTRENDDFTGTREGVQVGLAREPVNNYIDNWTNYTETISANGLGTANPPGKVSVRSTADGTAYFALTSDNSWSVTNIPFSLANTRVGISPYLVEFETLGTYVIHSPWI